MMLTQGRLKELVSYDPVTGSFAWLNCMGGRAQKGSVAGTLKNTGYVCIRVDQTNYQAHRLVWLYVYGCFPPDEIDHINHNKADNRLENLRATDRSENSRNQRLGSKNTSGVCGVSWFERDSCWRAFIKVRRKYIHLGLFKLFEDAVAARIQAEEFYGFHPNHGIEVRS